MENRNSAVFILTNGRPDRVYTIQTLLNQGYTGKYYLIIDNLDKTADRYKELYGDKVVVFDKEDIARRYDTGDNFNDMRAIFYARNASFEIAKKLGIEYFIQLDDDYLDFSFRFNSKKQFQHHTIKNLDRVFEYMFQLYDTSGALTIAMAQGGDYVGGGDGFGKDIRIKRKAMNSFFCSTKRPFQFYGRINEDVNTYTLLGLKGELIFTPNIVALNQVTTQANPGGMAEMYLDNGTFLKSFYSVMYAPSCVKISQMGNKYKRIHHKVLWNNCTPKIISCEKKKNGLS